MMDSILQQPVTPPDSRSQHPLVLSFFLTIFIDAFLKYLSIKKFQNILIIHDDDRLVKCKVLMN